MGHDYSHECFDKVWEKDVHMNTFGSEINFLKLTPYNNTWSLKAERVLDNDTGLSVDLFRQPGLRTSICCKFTGVEIEWFIISLWCLFYYYNVLSIFNIK